MDIITTDIVTAYNAMLASKVLMFVFYGQNLLLSQNSGSGCKAMSALCTNTNGSNKKNLSHQSPIHIKI